MNKNIRLLLPITILMLASLACQAVGLPFGKTATPGPTISAQAVAPTTIPDLVSSPSLNEQEDVMTTLYSHVTPGIVSTQNVFVASPPARDSSGLAGRAMRSVVGDLTPVTERHRRR